MFFINNYTILIIYYLCGRSKFSKKTNYRMVLNEIVVSDDNPAS